MGGYSTTLLMSVRDRVIRLKDAPYWGDNDALYNLIQEVVVEKYLPNMNKQFGKTHSIKMAGGGGTTGSFTTAIEVEAPREWKTGFWGRLGRLFNPTKTVIYLSFIDLGLYSRCDANYREFAEKMKQDFDKQIAPYLK